MDLASIIQIEKIVLHISLLIFGLIFLFRLYLAKKRNK